MFFLFFSNIFILFFFSFTFNVFANNINLIYLFIAYLNFLFFNTQFVLLSISALARSSTYICILIFFYFFTKARLIWLISLGGEQWVNALNYGLNSIHPNLFYLGLILLFYLNFFFKYSFKVFLMNSLGITILALILGMYWGSINAGWGFFWSNDAIEYILILIIILILHIQHFLIHKNKLWMRQYFYISIIFTLFLIRFNLFFSVHSFFTAPHINSLIFSIFSTLFIFNLNNIFYGFFIFYIFLFILFILISFIIIEVFDTLITNVFLYFLHVNILIFLYFLLLNVYYYGVLANDLNFTLSWVFNSVGLVWDYTKYVHSDIFYQNKYTTLNLYTIIYTNIISYITNLYVYIYYMGFYYYVYIYLLISLYKIYTI